MAKFVKVLKWIPSVFIICVSWYLSGKEHIDGLPSFWNADKIVHLICFAGLSFWVSFGCNISKRSKFYLPVSIVSFYGFIDEFHQSFTPNRSVSVFDWFADTTGAFLGVFVFLIVLKILKSNHIC